MATLTLTQVWVNRLDTGEGINANSGRDRDREHAMAGDVRSYAGGRQRAYTVAGEQSKFEFSLRLLTQATVDKLRSWIGVPVQVRDVRGQRFFGVFFAVPVTEQSSPTLYDVSISLKVVTIVEGV